MMADEAKACPTCDSENPDERGMLLSKTSDDYVDCPDKFHDAPPQPAQSDCGPGPNDRCRTVRCWNHREVQPAPAGFSQETSMPLQADRPGEGLTFEEMVTALHKPGMRHPRFHADTCPACNSLRAAHAKEVEEARQEAVQQGYATGSADANRLFERTRDESRAAGKREVARRVQNWIDGRTVGYPHGDLKDLRDWMQQWIGEEKKG